jgi:penicillin amidase
MIKFVLALLATVLLIWQLGVQHKIGDNNLPALGGFFNPFSGFWKNAEPVRGLVPSGDGGSLPGLKGKVEVIYDDLLVPHIFAQNLEDAMMTQGYVTASHRLWQMDITIRKASGRLSEVLGDRTLQIDRMARRHGLDAAAENSLLTWKKSEENARLLAAYTAGVNAYIDQLKPADYPIEFKLLGYEPEPWSDLKSAYVFTGMAETLSLRENDFESTNALALFGSAFDSIYPEWDPKQHPIVPDTGQWSKIKPNLPIARPLTGALGGVEAPPSEFEQLADADLLGPEPYIKGSNNWVVGGSRTRSGRPILANDPHLNLTLPSIWYQVQLHTPQLNCYGVSLPGFPGIIIGFNDDISWGVTNTEHDVVDWYKMKWTNPEKTKYELDGEVREISKRIETIKIKGKPDLIDTVKYTAFGPIVFDFDPQNPMRDCSMRWLAHGPASQNSIQVFLRMGMGKNFDDYKKAIADFDVPGQNIIFASRSGDIAVTVHGKIPIRAKEQGRFVQDGSMWQNSWHDFVPDDQLPCLKNPSNGFAFSANQNSVPPSYPYPVLGYFDHFRNKRIYNRLEAMHNATADSLKTMQLDNYSIRAASVLPAMLHLLNRRTLDVAGQEMASELAVWNYIYDPGQEAPGIFNVWWDSCYAKIWDEMDALHKNDQPVLWPGAWHTIDMITADTLNRFFDHPKTAARETARDIVQESFVAMESYYKQHPEQKTSWGKAKGFAIKHLALLKPFSRMDVVVGGDKAAPNSIGKGNGPSWRMIVDMGDPVHAQGVYPGGQSGNPGSKYYDNMVDQWAKGGYYDLLVLHAPDEKSDRILGRQTFSPK